MEPITGELSALKPTTGAPTSELQPIDITRQPGLVSTSSVVKGATVSLTALAIPSPAASETVTRLHNIVDDATDYYSFPSIPDMSQAVTTPSFTPTPTIWPTVTRQVLPAEVAANLVPCSHRAATDDLLIFVSQQFGLPETYVPPNLVLLSDYFGISVTLGMSNQVQLDIVEPLRRMIEAMHAVDLNPSIISGYRSYSEQHLAWKWWNSQYPDRVAIMSARAGHSEHQLGTTIDFGSPSLNHLFHVDFAGTPEGTWLAENAHLYGFTMSYPANTYEITGFKYEPWHYRYVGKELSEQLRQSGLTLTEWQLEQFQPPCIP
jgi:zinc D-Ala-D-Ala carboxypeptidase